MLAVQETTLSPESISLRPVEPTLAPPTGDFFSGADFTARGYREGVHEQRGCLGLPREQIEKIITLS